jgi:PhzF family phenazine biosynthesis protein
MRIFQVDSFTNKPFTGNPAGVCILPEDIPDSEMLNIAKEMNLPETAFLQGNGVGYNLRWFTPIPRSNFAVTRLWLLPIFCGRLET